ncbi:phage holin family protein [Flavobacterium sp.]|uniref:phage holin family protein n=1 Tax=Flavobacterium sp. TaxID=239 RepID=UPI0022BE2B2F|nr:phage holin family protein [Flavobacterium sp.]MCZ8229083.1 phage holin family protein [Flavobacterium sp.]
MNMILRLFITAGLVLLLSNIISGVHVASFVTSLIVAFVLGLINIFIKPIMVVLTLPFTIVTFGFFLLIINGLVIVLCTKIVGGFVVDSFWTALLFSLVLSISQSIAYGIFIKEK